MYLYFTLWKKNILIYKVQYFVFVSNHKNVKVVSLVVLFITSLLFMVFILNVSLNVNQLKTVQQVSPTALI